MYIASNVSFCLSTKLSGGINLLLFLNVYRHFTTYFLIFECHKMHHQQKNCTKIQYHWLVYNSDFVECLIIDQVFNFLYNLTMLCITMPVRWTTSTNISIVHNL